MFFSFKVLELDSVVWFWIITGAPSEVFWLYPAAPVFCIVNLFGLVVGQLFIMQIGKGEMGSANSTTILLKILQSTLAEWKKTDVLGFDSTRHLRSWSLFWNQWDASQEPASASCMVLCWAHNFLCCIGAVEILRPHKSEIQHCSLSFKPYFGTYHVVIKWLIPMQGWLQLSIMLHHINQLINLYINQYYTIYYA